MFIPKTLLPLLPEKFKRRHITPESISASILKLLQRQEGRMPMGIFNVELHEKDNGTHQLSFNSRNHQNFRINIQLSADGEILKMDKISGPEQEHIRFDKKNNAELPEGLLLAFDLLYTHYQRAIDTTQKLGR